MRALGSPLFKVLIDSWKADVNEAWLVDGLAQASFAPIRMVTNSALSDTACFASLFKLATLAPLTARFVAGALGLFFLFWGETLFFGWLGSGGRGGCVGMGD